MKNIVLLLGVVALLAACQSGDQAGLAGTAAFERCQGKNLDIGSEFNDCVNDVIRRECARQGYTEDPGGYRQCVRDNRRAAVVQSQITPLRGIGGTF